MNDLRVGLRYRGRGRTLGCYTESKNSGGIVCSSGWSRGGYGLRSGGSDKLSGDDYDRGGLGSGGSGDRLGSYGRCRLKIDAGCGREYDSCDGIKSGELSSSGGDRLGWDGGNGLGCGGGKGLLPGSGGRLSHNKLGCKGTNHLGSECDDQNGGNGLNRAGDGTKDGGRLVGHWHRNRLSTCAGGYDGDDRKSDEGCTKSGKQATKRVGIRAIQGEEFKSAPPARIVFDKDNPPRR